jgi:hypothetical protein
MLVPYLKAMPSDATTAIDTRRVQVSLDSELTVNSFLRTTIHGLQSISPYSHLRDRYSDFYINDDGTRVYGVSPTTGNLVEVPPHEWMTPAHYREHLFHLLAISTD